MVDITTRYYSDKELDDLIYHLTGTCMTMLEACNDLGMDEDCLTIADLRYIEDEIFQCPCGWWCEVCEGHDVDGELVCDDCYDS